MLNAKSWYRSELYQIKNIESLLPFKRFMSLHSVPFPRGMEEETGGMMDGIFSGSSGHCDNRLTLLCPLLLWVSFTMHFTAIRWCKILYLNCHRLTTIILETINLISHSHSPIICSALLDIILCYQLQRGSQSVCNISMIKVGWEM